MNQITNNRITGFECSDPVIRIYLPSGALWYIYKTNGIKTRFNLPSGNFLTENKIKQLEKPVQFKLPLLPAKNHFPKTLPEFKIHFIENPNKCSVNVQTGNVYFDYSFKNFPPFVLQFILFHEVGHLFYRGKGMKSENDCDVFSAYHCIRKGLNPSQVKIAQGMTLKSEYRKQHLFNYLKKVK